MNKLRFLLGTAIVLCLVLVLCLNTSRTERKKENRNTHQRDSVILVQTPTIAKADIQMYNLRKGLLEEKISNYFENAIKTGKIIGAGVSVVKGDSVLFNGGFGKRKSTAEQTINGKTVFKLGSLSKGFAGVLAADLIDQNKLNLDHKVGDYLSEFQFWNKEHSDKVSLRHILSHTSGTAYHSYTDLVEAGLSLTDIASRFSKVKPISEPGALYSYQNAIFALSGEVMAKVSNKTFENLLSDNIFKPLNMVTASANFEGINNLDNVAFPHKKRRGWYRPLKLTNKYYNAVAAGGINASAQDMGQWMKHLLHKQLKSTQSHGFLAFKPMVDVKGKSKYYQKWDGHISSHYGLGWRIHKYKNSNSKEPQTIIHHGGSVNSYRNEIALFPNEDLGICVLFNSNTKLAKTVIPELHKIIDEVMCLPVDCDDMPALADLD